jgi:long-chain acyl-CoA synthetase
LFHGLYAGVRNILEWDYSRLNSVLQQTNPSIFLGVPLIFNKIKDTAYEKGGSKLKFGLAFSNFLMRFKIDIRKKLFKDLHAYFGNDYYFSVCGGSVANPSTNKFFNDIGLPLYNGYGMTETSGPITICYENNNRYDSVGKILHNDIKVINSDENGVGEICIAGANIIKQYVNNENADCFADGYFNTGDLGYVKDGFLYITGRKKEILIGDNGKNISTAELLEKIMRHPGINDCVLKMENNKILAIIDTSLSSDDVSKHIKAINATLPNFKKISNFKIIQKGFKEKPDL